MKKQRRVAAKARPGRPVVDAVARPAPTLSVQGASRRYRIGRDQMTEAVRRGEIPTIIINGRPRIITSKADEKFGITA